jgi:hypothetical protein
MIATAGWLCPLDEHSQFHAKRDRDSEEDLLLNTKGSSKHAEYVSPSDFLTSLADQVILHFEETSTQRDTPLEHAQKILKISEAIRACLLLQIVPTAYGKDRPARVDCQKQSDPLDLPCSPTLLETLH